MTRLGVDFGTSNTVAVLRSPDRPVRPLLFDGSPQLPSAVFADPAGGLLTGRDAVHHARTHPERFAPHPKRDIDDGTVLLGDAEPRVPEIIGAVLQRVRDEAARVAGTGPAELVLTHPAAWGPRRRGVLVAAAETAGLPSPVLVAEPVAAAAYFVDAFGARVPAGGCVVVYDFGAGTFDASVVRRVGGGFEVLASVGLPDTGGLDVDAAVVSYLLTADPGWDPALRQRLERPAGPEDRRARMLLWEDARGAKEMLSRTASTFIHVPLFGVDVAVGRDQLEQLAKPIIARTVTATKAALRDARVSAADVSGVFLVGGASRMPLAATMLHQSLGIAPTVLDQPELVVAEGAVRLPETRPAAQVVPAPDVVPAAQVVSRAVRAAPRRPGRRRRTAVLVSSAALVLVAAAGAAYATRPEPRAGSSAASSPSPGSPTDSPAAGSPAVTAPSRLTAFPAALTGTWAGTLTQTTDGTTFPVEVRIPSGATSGSVRYPKQNCSGTLTLTGADAEEWKLIEDITSGARDCTAHGTITLKRSRADRFLFTYFPANGSYSVSGVLTRR